MAANEVSYEWREDSLGEYSRPLYGSEVMFAAASTYDGMASVLTSVTVDNASTDDLREAWTKLSVLVPLIRLELSREPGQGLDYFKWIYKTPMSSHADAYDWNKKTCLYVEAATLQDLRAHAIKNDNLVSPAKVSGTCPVAILFLSPAGGDAHMPSTHCCMLTHHSITDGRSHWMILDKLFGLLGGELSVPDLTGYRWGTADVNKLPRPFQYASDLRRDGDTPPHDPMQILGDFQQKQQEAGPTCTFPNIEGHKPLTANWAHPQGAVITKSFKISRADYAAVHSYAKLHGSTATSWVTATAVLLMAKFNVTKDAKAVMIPAFPIDARWQLPIGRDKYYGLASELTNIFIHDVDNIREVLAQWENDDAVPSNFWKLTAQIKQEVEATKHNTAALSVADVVQKIIAGAIAADPSLLDGSTTFITSMGRAGDHMKATYGSETKGKSISIKELSTQPLSHASGFVVMSFMEWEGELSFVVQFPTNLFEPKFASEYGQALDSFIDKFIRAAKMGK